jgi:GrpB-like predicted nucleotidyltransferase (UPF0157 family)
MAQTSGVDDERVHFSNDSAVFERAATRFAREAARIRRVVPDGDVQHVGGTAVPGCRTKGDLDIQVLVPAPGLDSAAAALATIYERDEANPPTGGRFSFRADGDLPVGVHLTAIGSGEDKFARSRDALPARPDLRDALDAIKAEYDGRSMLEYRDAKAAFFDALEQDAQG